MRRIIFVWIVGSMFAFGVLVHQNLQLEPKDQMPFARVVFYPLIMWPAVLGFEASRLLNQDNDR